MEELKAQQQKHLVQHLLKNNQYRLAKDLGAHLSQYLDQDQLRKANLERTLAKSVYSQFQESFEPNRPMFSQTQQSVAFDPNDDQSAYKLENQSYDQESSQMEFRDQEQNFEQNGEQRKSKILKLSKNSLPPQVKNEITDIINNFLQQSLDQMQNQKQSKQKSASLNFSKMSEINKKAQKSKHVKVISQQEDSEEEEVSKYNNSLQKSLNIKENSYDPYIQQIRQSLQNSGKNQKLKSGRNTVQDGFIQEIQEAPYETQGQFTSQAYSETHGKVNHSFKESHRSSNDFLRKSLLKSNLQKNKKFQDSRKQSIIKEEYDSMHSSQNNDVKKQSFQQAQLKHIRSLDKIDQLLDSDDIKGFNSLKKSGILSQEKQNARYQNNQSPIEQILLQVDNIQKKQRTKQTQTAENKETQTSINIRNFQKNKEIQSYQEFSDQEVDKVGRSIQVSMQSDQFKNVKNQKKKKGVDMGLGTSDFIQIKNNKIEINQNNKYKIKTIENENFDSTGEILQNAEQSNEPTIKHVTDDLTQLTASIEKMFNEKQNTSSQASQIQIQQKQESKNIYKQQFKTLDQKVKANSVFSKKQSIKSQSQQSFYSQTRMPSGQSFIQKKQRLPPQQLSPSDFTNQYKKVKQFNIDNGDLSIQKLLTSNLNLQNSELVPVIEEIPHEENQVDQSIKFIKDALNNKKFSESYLDRLSSGIQSKIDQNQNQDNILQKNLENIKMILNKMRYFSKGLSDVIQINNQNNYYQRVDNVLEGLQKIQTKAEGGTIEQTEFVQFENSSVLDDDNKTQKTVQVKSKITKESLIQPGFIPQMESHHQISLKEFLNYPQDSKKIKSLLNTDLTILSQNKTEKMMSQDQVYKLNQKGQRIANSDSETASIIQKVQNTQIQNSSKGFDFSKHHHFKNSETMNSYDQNTDIQFRPKFFSNQNNITLMGSAITPSASGDEQRLDEDKRIGKRKRSLFQQAPSVLAAMIKIAEKINKRTFFNNLKTLSLFEIAQLAKQAKQNKVKQAHFLQTPNFDGSYKKVQSSFKRENIVGTQSDAATIINYKIKKNKYDIGPPPNALEIKNQQIEVQKTLDYDNLTNSLIPLSPKKKNSPKQKIKIHKNLNETATTFVFENNQYLNRIQDNRKSLIEQISETKKDSQFPKAVLKNQSDEMTTVHLGSVDQTYDANFAQKQRAGNLGEINELENEQDSESADFNSQFAKTEAIISPHNQKLQTGRIPKPKKKKNMVAIGVNTDLFENEKFHYPMPSIIKDQNEVKNRLFNSTIGFKPDLQQNGQNHIAIKDGNQFQDPNFYSRQQIANQMKNYNQYYAEQMQFQRTNEQDQYNNNLKAKNYQNDPRMPRNMNLPIYPNATTQAFFNNQLDKNQIPKQNSPDSTFYSGSEGSQYQLQRKMAIQTIHPLYPHQENNPFLPNVQQNYSSSPFRQKQVPFAYNNQQDQLGQEDQLYIKKSHKKNKQFQQDQRLSERKKKKKKNDEKLNGSQELRGSGSSKKLRKGKDKYSVEYLEQQFQDGGDQALYLTNQRPKLNNGRKFLRPNGHFKSIQVRADRQSTVSLPKIKNGSQPDRIPSTTRLLPFPIPLNVSLNPQLSKKYKIYLKNQQQRKLQEETNIRRSVEQRRQLTQQKILNEFLDKMRRSKEIQSGGMQIY